MSEVQTEQVNWKEVFDGPERPFTRKELAARFWDR